MKKKYFSLVISALLLGSLTACSDWLDVEQNSEKKADEMFDNYDGFKGALAGCYADLAQPDLYGTRLTMSTIESLAALWYQDGGRLTSYKNKIRENYYFRTHDYTHSTAEDIIRSIYSRLYNAVLETNLIIQAFEDGKGDVIADPKSRSVIEGEAYALRAFLQFDILRLFGEVPGGMQKVELPYSEVTRFDESLNYCSFDAYVEKLKADMDKAVSLLKDNDPLSQYTYKEIDNIGKSGYEDVSLDDDFMYYRRYRMNYWAVRALQARVNMYIGESQAAHDLALEVINGTVADGDKVIGLSSKADYGSGSVRNFASPSECLFSLYFDNLHEISVPLLCGSPTYAGAVGVEQVDDSEQLTITEDMKADLFLGCDVESDIRARFMWADTRTNQSRLFPTLSKYYVNESGVIPLLRLSEMYLIAIESSTDLNEANGLYDTYMTSKNVARHDYFQSLDDVKPEMEKEYRRELFGEGQMFYFYKRNKTSLLWSSTGEIMTEDKYILPLPDTEKR